MSKTLEEIVEDALISYAEGSMSMKAATELITESSNGKAVSELEALKGEIEKQIADFKMVDAGTTYPAVKQMYAHKTAALEEIKKSVESRIQSLSEQK